jgi:hypothetical protein
MPTDDGDSTPSRAFSLHRRFPSERTSPMDAVRFDAWTRSLAVAASSRRRLLRLVVGSAAGVAASAFGMPLVEATHHGCLHVGARCKQAQQCCSSRCRGKVGHKRCRAHGVLGCTRGTVDDVTCLGAGCGTGCSCANTTGGAAFCAQNSGCFTTPCSTDEKCAVKTGIPGAACIECPFCTGGGAGTGCAEPCTTP